MPFQGFNVKYPEYEFITPQTQQSFTIRSLNVQEEEKLKGSLITPSKITEHLNACIYDALVKKPDNIKDLNSFLKNTTIKDRDAALFALYSITYEDIRNYQVKCSECQKQYPITIKATDTFNFNPYPGKDILTKKVKVDLLKTVGVSVYLRQPTLLDEIKAIRELSSRPGSTVDLIIETLIIEKFVQESETAKEPVEYSDRSDIIDAYLTLPSKDKREIHNQYSEVFGKYGIELKMKSYCPSCANEEEIDIDLVENFFRALYSV